ASSTTWTKAPANQVARGRRRYPPQARSHGEKGKPVARRGRKVTVLPIRSRPDYHQELDFQYGGFRPAADWRSRSIPYSKEEFTCCGSSASVLRARRASPLSSFSSSF